jgi:hypothetical protein
MKDLLSLGIYLSILVGIVALSSPMSFVEWLRREWRLIREDSWAVATRDPHLLTAKHDPRCRRMVIRLRSMGVHLRNSGVRPRVEISSTWQNDANPNAYRFARRDA